MSKFIGRMPLPPITGYNDTLAWDGTEFRPTRSVSINPVFAAISAAALALAIGTGISDANAIGFLPDTSIAGSEALTLYVGGKAGPKWTAGGGVVALDLQGGGLSAAALKSSVLTSGRVPFYSAGGLTDSSAFTVSGGSVTATSYVAGDGTGSPFIRLNGVTGSGRYVQWQTAGSLRWRAGATSTAEGGSDAGSNWVLEAFADDGSTSLGAIITANRAAAGALVFTRPLQPGSGSVGAPSFAFSTDTTTGFFRAASGAIGLSQSGTEVLRLGAAFMINRNAVAMNTSPITSVGTFTLHGADAGSASLSLCSYGNSTQLQARRANGTGGSLTGLTNGDSIFILTTQGYEPTTPGFATARNAYIINPRETWSNTAQGYAHVWNTTANGGTTNSEKMRLENSGNLLIGTTTDGLTAAGSLAIAQDLAHRGTNLGVFNTTPTTKKTGYGTPTGNAYQASFAAGAITTANLAAAVAQLIIDLKAYGLIGA